MTGIKLELDYKVGERVVESVRLKAEIYARTSGLPDALLGFIPRYEWEPLLSFLSETTNYRIEDAHPLPSSDASAVFVHGVCCIQDRDPRSTYVYVRSVTKDVVKHFETVPGTDVIDMFADLLKKRLET